MTVAELIEALKAMPQDAKVMITADTMYGIAEVRGVDLDEDGEVTVYG